MKVLMTIVLALSMVLVAKEARGGESTKAGAGNRAEGRERTEGRERADKAEGKDRSENKAESRREGADRKESAGTAAGKGKEASEGPKVRKEGETDKTKENADGTKPKETGEAAKPKTPGKVETVRENSIDARQANQANRIQNGIQRGALTPTEITRLKGQQESIAKMENAFKSDGKLTGNEFKQLQSALNDASRSIWAEKHDTDGRQLAVSRLGKDILARPEFTARMNDPNLKGSDARKLLGDFRRIIELKHSLATEDMSEAKRKKAQEDYDHLLNEYFMAKQA